VAEWVVFDYGGVLCTDQPADDRRALAVAAGVDPDDAGAVRRFWAGYWRHRDAYDRAELDSPAYWTAVLGAEPDDVAAVDRADVTTWSHPYERTLALVPRLADRGTGVALLSNAPAALAAAVDRMSWTDLVPHRFFSCRLRASKPDPAIYRAVLDRLDARPEQVTFVDDRPANVAGAEAVGIRGLLFTDPTVLAAELDLQGEM